MSHKKFQHLISTRGPKLFHMNLSGPMQEESVGGKIYIFNKDDEYSRIKFINGKCDILSIFEPLFLCLQHEKGEEIGKIIRIRSQHGR